MRRSSTRSSNSRLAKPRYAPVSGRTLPMPSSMQLHQQRTRTGDAPAVVDGLLASFGLGEAELASSKASSEAAEFEDIMIINQDGGSLAGAGCK